LRSGIVRLVGRDYEECVPANDSSFLNSYYKIRPKSDPVEKMRPAPGRGPAASTAVRGGNDRPPTNPVGKKTGCAFEKNLRMPKVACQREAV
jgi:hypothetical protein